MAGKMRTAAIAGLMGGLFTAGVALTQSAAAQSAVAQTPAGQTQVAAVDHGGSDIEEVVVTASPLGPRRFDVLQGTSVLSGEALDKALSANIGEALDRLPGVSQTGFGQGASRPIIRGLGGDRIRILVGGIGTIDASTTSPDHAPAVELATAKRVEVVRGPATLLYGSNATGGVVNVLDGRIPVAKPENGAAGMVRLGYGSNADERMGATSLDAAVGTSPVVLHVDGYWRKTDDMHVDGFVRSAALRASDPLADEPRGKVENSDLEQKGVTGGASVVGDWGFLGASITRDETNYGIPGGDPDEEGTRIDLGQTRVDLMGEVNMDTALFETARVRFGWADYEHKEMEGEEVGTRFLNKGWEGRLEMVQKRQGDLSGAVGVQATHRDFQAIGEESFLPKSDTLQLGLFTVQRLDLGPWALEAGGRVERQTVKADAVDFDRDFTMVSLSTGVSYTLPGGWLAGVSLSRTERAPNAEELLSDGPHDATRTYERGDASLGKETALGGEVTLKKTGGPVDGSVNLFYTRYDDFVFERLTGAEEDGLPVAQFTATDARFWGFELEASTALWRQGDKAVTVDAGLDYVRATDTNRDEPLPRMPPLSLRGGIGYEMTQLATRVEVVRTGRQDRNAAFETETKGATVLNASIDWHPFADRDVSLMLEGRNLTDEEVRLATSFLKDEVPQPGRDIRLLLKVGF